jgi:hypothetical protein
VGDDAEFLLPSSWLDDAEALPFSNRIAQLKEPAVGIDGDREGLFFEVDLVLIFPSDAKRDSREDPLSSSEQRQLNFLSFDEHGRSR